MQTGMTIEDLLNEVVRQKGVRRDFVANTRDAVRMVQQEDELAIVLLRDGADQLERFGITENFHRQVSDKLGIPWKYYGRLLEDHPDMVVEQVNKLFEREPAGRMLRALDGNVRAFLSDRYRRLDNDEVLENVLPPLVKGDVPNVCMSSHVGENSMHLKVLFTDDSLAQDIGDLPKGRNTAWVDDGAIADVDRQHRVIARRDAGRDIVRPGAVISNSETGRGSLKVQGFFFRSYCLNGCIFGQRDAFEFSRPHIGGQLIADAEFEVFSDDTKRLQDQTLIAEMTDALQTMTNPDRVRAMGDKLRSLKNNTPVENPVEAVDQLARELVDFKVGDKSSILEAFIGDQDYTQWGMVNAVTAQANRDDISYERACEFESLGAKLIDMNRTQWNRIAKAERVAA